MSADPVVTPEIRHQKEDDMITRLIKAALLAMILAAIVQSLPDIKRYLDIRSM
jgi:hypothetical protein